jgi:hypothetical protein
MITSDAGTPFALGSVRLEMNGRSVGVAVKTTESFDALVATLPAHLRGRGTLHVRACPRVAVSACEGVAQCFVGGLCADEAQWSVTIQ